MSELTSTLSPKTLKAIAAERDRQDAKFGGGAGTRGLDVATWLEVLAEEVGEVARARLGWRNEPEIIKAELIQVAAVAVAAIEDCLGVGQSDVLNLIDALAVQFLHSDSKTLFLNLLHRQGEAAYVASVQIAGGYCQGYVDALANVGAIAALLYQQEGREVRQ